MIVAALLALAGLIPEGLRFEPWFTERGIAVSIARVPNGIPWIRGVTELPVSADTVLEIITDYPHYRELMSPAVKEVTVLEKGPGTARLHFVWPYPFPFRNRDAIVAYRQERLDDGVLLVSWQDAVRPGDPHEGARIHRVAGQTRIEPLDRERCRVTYTYLGDLGGKFPKAAEEKAWRNEPIGYMLALRRRLRLPVPPKGGHAGSAYSPRDGVPAPRHAKNQ
ncbi:MAG TPA: START domain-containing protein [Thermoanaerobaculia bacterium]|jgi:hypothetical protein